MHTINEVRDYWNRRPCNIRHSPRSRGSREYFDEVETQKYLVEPHIPAFADFKTWKSKKVLEIGCGIGTDTINFARAGALVTAVDLSEKSLSLAKMRAEIYGLDIDFYSANAEELTSVVPIEPYDLVYSFGVIHHTPNPIKALYQIKEYMADQSKLKLMVYNRNSWKVFWILLKYGKGKFWNLDELITRYSEAQTGCPVTYTYTKKSIKNLLKNFEILNLNIDHIFTYRIPDYLKHRYKRVWYFRWIPAPIFRWMEKKWGWHICIEAKLANN